MHLSNVLYTSECNVNKIGKIWKLKDLNEKTIHKMTNELDEKEKGVAKMFLIVGMLSSATANKLAKTTN